MRRGSLDIGTGLFLSGTRNCVKGKSVVPSIMIESLFLDPIGTAGSLPSFGR